MAKTRIKKGMFSVVPVASIEWLHPYAQTIYLRMCKFMNENGVCYPSISTLMKVTGISSRNAVKKYTTLLINQWLLQKSTRYENNNQISNEYEVLIDDVFIEGVGHEMTGGRSWDDLGVGHEMTTELIPVRTSPNKLIIKGIGLEEFKEKISPVINLYIVQWYKQTDLEHQGELCRYHHQEKKGISNSVTAYDNWIKIQIKREKMSKPKKQMEYANYLSDD